jgi:bifunctional DNA primase/polymerase-like protein/primase-like protein
VPTIAADMNESLATAAVEYATAGLPVFPVRGKRPLTRHGYKDASVDAQQVLAWWRRWPRANIGLPTGNGLVVIDVDPRNGGEVDPAWPTTRTARTPSDGRHLYFHCTTPIGCSAGKLARGVDVRGEGGYVVAPPSPGWEWLDERVPLRLKPSFFGASTRPPVPRAVFSASDPFEWRESVPEGERNSYMASAAGHLYRLGFDREAVTETLLRHNETFAAPLPEQEVHRVAASIGRYHL